MNSSLAVKATSLCLRLSFLFILITMIEPAFGQTSGDNRPLSDNIGDWIVKDICVNQADQPIAADPYNGCPTGTTRRKIQVGDGLPYHNTGQFNEQQSDSFPLLDAKGHILYFHTFDWAPFNSFALNSGSDGYDTWTVDTDWFSGASTRDGGGYGQQFFGPDCRPTDGWVFFPSTGFLSGGQKQTPIQSSYWEQNLMSSPGVCSQPPTDGPLTSWEHQVVSYGGINGNPIKTMDTMISYHNAQVNGNPVPMEVFYFTQEYGLTMWQSWVPNYTNPSQTTNCLVANTVFYQGNTYTVADCHDWSRVTLATSANIPQWPLPPANLLQHSHFDDQGGYLPNNDPTIGVWHRGGESKEGNIINWSLRNSTTAQDTKYGSGVRYLAINCAGTCTGPSVQEIYQEVPISRIPHNSRYLYGIDVRTEAEPGIIQVTLQELDADNNVLWGTSIQGNVSHDNGDGRNNEGNSVYLSSVFVSATTTIPVYKNAAKVRFYITPITPQTFDILDSWFNRFPKENAQIQN